MTLRALLLLLAIVASGLIAGLFFAWVVSVIPGTAQVSDTTYVSTMQNINREIINPAFVGTFLVAPILLAAAAFAANRAGENRRAWLLVAAAVTYVAGVMGVTFGGNIPLNDELEPFNLAAATSEQTATARNDYEGPWNRWNNGRTVASIAAFTLAVGAALIDVEADA